MYLYVHLQQIFNLHSHAKVYSSLCFFGMEAVEKSLVKSDNRARWGAGRGPAAVAFPALVLFLLPALAVASDL